MIEKQQQIALFGNEIADAIDSLEGQGYQVDFIDEALLAVYEDKVSVFVKFTGLHVLITLSCSEHSPLRKRDHFNIFATENAVRKIIDTVNEYLEAGLNAVYLKGGDTA